MKNLKSMNIKKLIIAVSILSVVIFKFTFIESFVVNIGEFISIHILQQLREPKVLLVLTDGYQTKNKDSYGNYKRIYDLTIESPYAQNSFQIDVTSSSTIRKVETLPSKGINLVEDCERVDSGNIDDFAYSIRCSNPKNNNYLLVIYTRDLYCGNYAFKVYVNDILNDFVEKKDTKENIDWQKNICDRFNR
jgi:hypothetical protein